MKDQERVRLQVFDSVDGPEPSHDQDQALLELIEAEAFRGRIALLYTRRPSPWKSLCRDGSRARLVTAWDRRDDTLLGMGAAVTHLVRDHGRIREMHYLSGFRMRETGRWGLRVMPQAYGALIEACGNDALFLTSILEENRAARRFLERPRRSLPLYSPLGGFTTLAVPAGRKRQLAGGLRWKRADTTDVPAILNLLSAQAARRPLFPAVDRADFCPGGRGPEVSQFVLLSAGEGSPVACGALWDQRDWKQYVVMGYQGVMRWVRPISLLFPLLGYPALPAVGTTLRLPIATLLATATAEPELQLALLTALSNAVEDAGMFLTGCPDGAPEAAVLNRLRGVRYRSLIYHVTPQNDGLQEPTSASLSETTPHVELAYL